MNKTNGTNGSGNGHDPHTEKDNVVHMPTLAERDRIRRQAEKEARRFQSKHNPAINLPPATKYMLGAFIGIYALTLIPGAKEWIFMHFAFLPGAWTGRLPFTLTTILTPVTHMFLHSGWIHLGMNGLMMAAFGAGAERWIGPKRMIVFFLLCGLCGVAAHFILNPFATIPVVGASGGLSGFFALALIMMNRQTYNPNARKQLIASASIFIAFSLLFVFVDAPGGGQVAWAAHIGGFLGGFALTKLMKI